MYVIKMASPVRSRGRGTGAPPSDRARRVSHSRLTQIMPCTWRPKVVFFSKATRTRRGLIHSPSRYIPSSRKSRRSSGWKSLRASSSSPVVRGFARHRCTDASLPLLIGRMTFSMSPSSKKCSSWLASDNAVAPFADLLTGIVDTRLEPRPMGASAATEEGRLRGDPGRTRLVRGVKDRDRSHRSSLLPVGSRHVIASHSWSC